MNDGADVLSVEVQEEGMNAGLMNVWTCVAVCISCLAFYRTTLSDRTGLAEEVGSRQISRGRDLTLEQCLDLGNQEAPDVIDEGGRQCGVYCLTLVLRLLGREYAFAEVGAESKVTDKGVSLSEMERVATKMGVPMKVVHCDPTSVWRLPFPAVAQTKPSPGRELNHYIVLLKATRESVNGVEASQGTLFEADASRVGDTLTGYFLVPNRLPAAFVEVVLSWFGGGLLGSGVALLLVAGSLAPQAALFGNFASQRRGSLAHFDDCSSRLW